MANYLPVLLVSVSTNAFPDDSSLTTGPRGQVDYLSHDWQEEDVWRSWRNMTRQKNEIANGVRLENASWRTWWKQRNKLKTVTPETLNWLKDSDVTWLYGPLHTAVEWTPPPRYLSTAHDPFDLSGSCGKKPILKHRSISELLTSDLPSPLFSPTESDEDLPAGGVSIVIPTNELLRPESTGLVAGGDDSSTVRRPALMRTKSDTSLMRNLNSALRKPSPPRIIAQKNKSSAVASGSNTSSTTAGGHSPSGASTIRSSSSEQDETPVSRNVGTNGINGQGKKKHISFNTFVEQFIAIDKPEGRRRKKKSRNSKGMGKGTWSTQFDEMDDLFEADDGYDEDAEDEYDGYGDSEDWDRESDSDEDDENDDDALEIRSASKLRSAKSKKPGLSVALSSAPSLYPRKRPSLSRIPSSTHVTIAPIAPTKLKTGNGWDGDGLGDEYLDANASDDGIARWLGGGRNSSGSGGAWAASLENGEGRNGSRSEVFLVYVPPTGSSHSLPMDGGEAEEEQVYHHRDVYLQSSPDPVPSVGIIPPSPAERDLTPKCFQPATAPSSQPCPSPERDQDVAAACPDLDAGSRLRRWSGRSEERDSGMLRYAQGGAASVADRHSNNDGAKRGSSSTPSDDDRRGRDVATRSGSSTSRSRSDERSRSRSQSRTPSPLFSPTTSTTPSLHHSPSGPASEGLSPERPPSPSSTLLSPYSRGRSSTPSNSESRESRGRSATRGSSFSDKDRSGSRGGNSPIGSLSPDGSASTIALGVGAQGRRTMRLGRSSPEDDAEVHGVGMNRVLVNGSRSSSMETDLRKLRGQSTSPLSGSSTASEPSTATLKTRAPRSALSDSRPDLVEPLWKTIPKSATATSTTTTATSIRAAGPTVVTSKDVLGEGETRSRYPTPANSPTILKPLPLPRHASSTQAQPLPCPETASASVTVPTGKPIEDNSSGTIVGRAFDAAFSAGTFLGRVWHTGA